MYMKKKNNPFWKENTPNTIIKANISCSRTENDLQLTIILKFVWCLVYYYQLVDTLPAKSGKIN